MDDIVKRLRHEAGMWDQDRSGDAQLYEIAADEIERLRAALDPFIKCAKGEILNPSTQDWERLKVLNEQKTVKEGE